MAQAAARCNVGAACSYANSRRPVRDEELLLYLIDTGQDPACPRCGEVMLLATGEVREGKPPLLTFRVTAAADRRSSSARTTRRPRLGC